MANKQSHEEKRTTVHCTREKLHEFRRAVAHAQRNGETSRTLVSSVDEAMDLVIKKIIKKYGEPTGQAALRPGRRIQVE